MPHPGHLDPAFPHPREEAIEQRARTLGEEPFDGPRRLAGPAELRVVRKGVREVAVAERLLDEVDVVDGEPGGQVGVAHVRVRVLDDEDPPRAQRPERNRRGDRRVPGRRDDPRLRLPVDRGNDDPEDLLTGGDRPGVQLELRAARDGDGHGPGARGASPSTRRCRIESPGRSAGERPVTRTCRESPAGGSAGSPARATGAGPARIARDVTRPRAARRFMARASGWLEGINSSTRQPTRDLGRRASACSRPRSGADRRRRGRGRPWYPPRGAPAHEDGARQLPGRTQLAMPERELRVLWAVSVVGARRVPPDGSGRRPGLQQPRDAPSRSTPRGPDRSTRSPRAEGPVACDSSGLPTQVLVPPRRYEARVASWNVRVLRSYDPNDKVGTHRPRAVPGTEHSHLTMPALHAILGKEPWRRTIHGPQDSVGRSGRPGRQRRAHRRA